jgi:hypothetical protein
VAETPVTAVLALATTVTVPTLPVAETPVTLVEALATTVTVPTDAVALTPVTLTLTELLAANP